jgi:predicted short-subunit dehydrogenase-like oxidoreductase (DUF2520 family)
MTTVSIIGIGRVGGAFALALPNDRYSLETLITRDGDFPASVANSISADVAKASSIQDADELASDVVLITTQDNEIAAAASQLLEKIRPGTVVFHTSGALSSCVLEILRQAQCVLGSLHPLVSISSPELGPVRFHGAFFCVEGDSQAVEIGKKIATDLGGRPFSVATEFKTLYHASAVTACGHLVALFDAAVEMMTRCGLDESESKQILLPLVKSTVNNLGLQSTAEALTGTFARADIETFTRHLTALNQYGSDELLEIYLLLGERSLELAAKQGVSRERIDSMRTKVTIAKSKLKW